MVKKSILLLNTTVRRHKLCSALQGAFTFAGGLHAAHYGLLPWAVAVFDFCSLSSSVSIDYFGVERLEPQSCYGVEGQRYVNAVTAWTAIGTPTPLCRGEPLGTQADSCGLGSLTNEQSTLQLHYSIVRWGCESPSDITCIYDVQLLSVRTFSTAGGVCPGAGPLPLAGCGHGPVSTSEAGVDLTRVEPVGCRQDHIVQAAAAPEPGHGSVRVHHDAPPTPPRR